MSRTPPPREIRRTSDTQSTLLPSRWELRDFVGGWFLLTVAFTILLVGGARGLVDTVSSAPGHLVTMAIVSAVAVGGGFVLHEYAHKAVAVWLGHDAAFRAHYGMLLAGIALALGGFIVAAPGGVHHRRDVPRRDKGLIALAGPVTNLLFGVVFLIPLVAAIFVVPGAVFTVGTGVIDARMLLALLGIFGVMINFLLAGFNMLPFGPLDGLKVYLWNGFVYAAVAVPSMLLALGSLAVFILFML